MKKFFLFVFLFSLLVVSFVPFVSSQGTYEDYLETLSPVWENNFDAGDWSGFAAHGASCSLVTDFVDGGYYMRVNTSTASSATYVTPSPALNYSEYSMSFDFYVQYPNVDNGGTLLAFLGYTSSLSGALAAIEWYHSVGGLFVTAHEVEPYTEITSRVWHHLTFTQSNSDDGWRSLLYIDGVLVVDWDNVVLNAYFDHSFKWGVAYNVGSKSVDVYMDNLVFYDEALRIDAPLPTATPTPSPVVVAGDYPPVDPFVAVPSYYMVLLVLFAVVAVLAGLYVTFEREGENKGVALLFVLVGLVLFVILIVGYFVGF